MFFPGRKFPFWYTQNKFPSFLKVKRKKRRRRRRSKKKKKKKKKKKGPHLFLYLYNFSYPTSISNFPSSLLQFSFFSSQFSPLFTFFVASIRKQKFPGHKSLGGALPPCPRLLHHCTWDYRKKLESIS